MTHRSLTNTVNGPPHRRPRLRLVPLLVLAVLALAVGLAPVTTKTAQAAPNTVVSLTFDDGNADQIAAAQTMNGAGLKGTFYITTNWIGQSGYMTQTDLHNLATAGNEIGGHTVHHPDLIEVSSDEVSRQACQGRHTLVSWGFQPTSFAYPYADLNASAEAQIQQCGFKTARAVGDLRSPHSCTNCPVAESIPPADAFATRTPDEIDPTWTLANLQSSVTTAERNGGGWLPFVFHHFCTNACASGISPTVFGQFMTWLKGRTATTTVKPVNQVVTGQVNDSNLGTAAPPPAGIGVNAARNPSLETVSPTDASRPDCWTPAGYGTNTATWTRTTDAQDGVAAEKLDITSRTDGDGKLLPRFDLGQCTALVTEGHTYTVSVWYKSTASTFITLYQRNAAGQYGYWTQSPRFAAASTWTLASWLAPAVPSGAAAVNFGLTLDGVGTLYTDNYGLVDTSPRAPAPPGVNGLVNPSLETADGNGDPQCWSAAGYGTNTPTFNRVSGGHTGSWAEQLNISSRTDGDAKLVTTFDAGNCAPSVTVGHPYTVSAWYTSTAPTFFTLYTRNASGTWSYWTQSPYVTAATAWTQATWTAPAVPAGVTAVSFGLTLDSVGTVTTDDYSLVDSSGSGSGSASLTPLTTSLAKVGPGTGKVPPPTPTSPRSKQSARLSIRPIGPPHHGSYRVPGFGVLRPGQLFPVPELPPVGKPSA